jgi:O-antigen ligase
MIMLSGARKGWLLVAAVGFSAMLGILSTAAESFGIVLLAAAVGIPVLMMIIGIWSIAGLATGLMVGAAFTVSMIALRAGSEVTLADVLLGASAVPVLIMAARKRSDANADPNVLRWHFPVLGLILLVVAGGLIGSFSAGDQALSLAELGRFAASSMVVVLLFWLWAPRRRSLELVSWVLVFGATVNAVLSLFLEKMGGRAMGLSTHPNHLALACCLAIGITLGLILSAPSRTQRFVLTVCLAALGAAVIVSGSRAGLAGVVVTIGTFLIVTRRWKLIAVGALAVGLVAMAVYFNLFAVGDSNAVNRIRGDRSSYEADQARLQMAHDTVDAIRLNPFTGSGFESAKSAHSIYLQLWASAGFLGILFAGGLILLAFKTLKEAVKRGDLLAMGLASSYAGYLVVGVVSNILWDRYVWVHLAVLVSLIATQEEPALPARGLNPGLKSRTPFPGRELTAH